MQIDLFRWILVSEGGASLFESLLLLRNRVVILVELVVFLRRRSVSSI